MISIHRGEGEGTPDQRFPRRESIRRNRKRSPEKGISYWKTIFYLSPATALNVQPPVVWPDAAAIAPRRCGPARLSDCKECGESGRSARPYQRAQKPLANHHHA